MWALFAVWVHELVENWTVAGIAKLPAPSRAAAVAAARDRGLGKPP